jgi:hypothetical protein
VHVGAYAIDDDPSIFNLVIASIVDRESFRKQCQQLDTTTRDYLTTRLDYYQVNIETSGQYRAGYFLTVEDNYPNIAVEKNTTNDCYSSLIWDLSIHKYTVRVITSRCMRITIGFAPSKLFDVSKRNSITCGWYLSLHCGLLYSQNGDDGRAYSSECKAGDTITCIYNSSSSEISF